ncbi:hypothetical protein B0H34DRAFT_400510 [Crassisporium funariophilum]|nr:hypothetical protein B0H34DRAFT_400510 [Crassisporium funariophilum]
MSIPQIPVLEAAAKKLVWDGLKKGTLKELTPRLVRQAVEKQFGLEEGALDVSEYKSAVKAATSAALAEEPPASAPEAKAEEPVTAKGKKRKSDVVAKAKETDLSTPKAKGKAKARQTKEEDNEVSVTKKRKISSVKKAESEEEQDDEGDQTPSAATKQRQKRKDTKQYKSTEHVPTSDMEQDDAENVNVAGPSIPTDSNPTSFREKKKVTPTQRKPSDKAAEGVSKPKPKPTPQDEDIVMGDVASKSESEMSVLEDSAPKRKRKSKPVDKETKKTTKTEKSTKSSTTLTKDEETIKRLKSLVLACGTRKVWSKLFETLDTPQQQIKKLKEILADLGMTGRMSLEQAKAIKEKRELAQELADVQQFEQTVLGRSSRSRTEATAKQTPVESNASDEDKGSDSDEVSAPRKRSTTARKSIMAFLEDQSDED